MYCDGTCDPLSVQLDVIDIKLISVKKVAGLIIAGLMDRLGPKVKKLKNGYPESSKDCYSINLKKYIWCIRNHCIASFSELHNATRANKVR